MTKLLAATLALGALTLAGCAQVLMVVVGGAGMVWMGVDFGTLEGWLRLLAAVALVWHPIQEQRLGFRKVFNARIHGYRWSHAQVIQFWREPPFESGPLSRRRNAAQATLLATVFPALALWGPWWAITFAFSFYVCDRVYTHGKKSVPGGWSAVVGAIALFALLLSMGVPPLTLRSGATVLAAVLAAGVALYAPWWMAYRTVRLQ